MFSVPEATSTLQVASAIQSALFLLARSVTVVFLLGSSVTVVFLLARSVTVVFLLARSVTVVFLLARSVTVVFLLARSVTVVFLLARSVTVVFLLARSVTVVFLLARSVTVVFLLAWSVTVGQVSAPVCLMWLVYPAGCICNSIGTVPLGEECDRWSGQCACLPNVVGQDCGLCAPHHWDMSSGSGCQPCSCDTSGSVSLDCNQVRGCLFACAITALSVFEFL